MGKGENKTINIPSIFCIPLPARLRQDTLGILNGNSARCLSSLYDKLRSDKNVKP